MTQTFKIIKLLRRKTCTRDCTHDVSYFPLFFTLYNHMQKLIQPPKLHRKRPHVLLIQGSLKKNAHGTHTNKCACTHTKRCYSFIHSFSVLSAPKKRGIWGGTVHSKWQHSLFYPLLSHTPDSLHSDMHIHTEGSRPW